MTDLEKEIAQYERAQRFMGWVIVALAGVMAGFGLFVWVMV